MKPLTNTAVRECHDGRNWDYRDPIQPPRSYRISTWIAWGLGALGVALFLAAIVSTR